MKGKRGQTIPIYVRGNMLHMYNKLKHHADLSERSISELVSRGIECVTMEQEASVQITPGAYFAMQDGRFDVLTRVHLGNGTVLISVKEDAYKSKDGTHGYEDKVRAFLSTTEEE